MGLVLNCTQWLSECISLTQLPLDKMAAVLADDNFKCIFLNENYRILIQISLNFVPKGPINNIPALVQIIAWRRTGDKPLPELMVTQFTDAYSYWDSALVCDPIIEGWKHISNHVKFGIRD